MIRKISLLSIAFIAIITFGNAANKKAKKPNIVYILADDLGYGDLSCLNKNSKISTPNLDKLSKQGVVFTDAHTSSSVCTPTRYGILTGRYNWRSTLKKGVLSGYSKALIPQDRMTVASFLQNKGYETGCIGKWHLGWDWNNIDNGKEKVDFSKKIKNGPTTLGFNYFYGFCGSLDMAPYVYVENDMPTAVPTKETQNKVKQAWWRKGLTSSDFDHEQVLPNLTSRAVSYIEKESKQEKPFFLYFPLPAPHTPVLPTEEFKGKSGLDNPYGDFVIMVDWVVGEIMKSLKEQGIEDNTMLVFTSDNGCSPQADYKQLATKGHDPSYEFRGHKADIFEGGHLVPFMVRWPQQVKPAESSQLMCTTDLFATVADVIGEQFPDEAAEDSYSFLPALKGKSNKKGMRKSVVHHSINGSYSIRQDEWKVIFCPGSGGWSFPKPSNKEEIAKLPKIQLYNLEKDIAEENNLQAQFPEKVKDLRSVLTKIVKDGRSTKGDVQKNDGPETWPQLSWMKEE